MPFVAEGPMQLYPGAKAPNLVLASSARLKPCPDTKLPITKLVVLIQLLKLVPQCDVNRFQLRQIKLTNQGLIRNCQRTI